MDFVAVRSIPDGSSAVESKCHHHFDVACPGANTPMEFGVRCSKTSFEKIGKIGSCSFFPMCAPSTKVRF